MAQAVAGIRTFGHYIGGKWTDPQGGQTFQTTNPATGEREDTEAQVASALIASATGDLG